MDKIFDHLDAELDCLEVYVEGGEFYFETVGFSNARVCVRLHPDDAVRLRNALSRKLDEIWGAGI
jgi:hypothetical protein